MHPHDIMRYGDATFRQSLGEIETKDWSTPGACGHWSVKDIIGHLASYEAALSEILRDVSGERADSDLIRRFADPAFNDTEVERRATVGPDEALEEYQRRTDENLAKVANIAEDIFRDTGRLSWYGPEYDLEDFLVYTFYGHKREHAAQVNAFKDSLTGVLEDL